MNLKRIEELIDKYLVDLVFNAAKIEGIRVDYFDIERLVNMDIEPNLTSDKIALLRNLVDSYKQLKDINFLNQPIDIFTMNKINMLINGRGLVHQVGQFRKDDVYFSNCSYEPILPDEYDINNHIKDIIEKDCDCLDKGIELYLYVMRSQPYIDGNKRTANVFANLYLLQNDCPIISMPSNKRDIFLIRLSKYYETNRPLLIARTIKKYGLLNNF